MKVPLLLVIQRTQNEHGLPMRAFYSMVELSRQGFHQALSRENREVLKWQTLPDLVKEYRKRVDARAGSRSLYFNLNVKSLYQVGITQFERKMAALGLTLPRLKTRVITTHSVIRSYNYHNQIKGLTVSGINQVVVGDITYIKTQQVWRYLFCLTDVYSGRIVGWNYSPTMTALDAYECLIQWEQLRGKEALEMCFHHSDGGGQYFSRLYLNKTGDLGVRMSRAENCLQNGRAEQINGLVKHHLIPNIQGRSVSKVRKELATLVQQYNNDRKQEGLMWMSPAEFERYVAQEGTAPLMKLYNFDPK
ncbi:MAG: transposase [Flavobacteriales bacterium]